jgi:hypothetical protein
MKKAAGFMVVALALSTGLFAATMTARAQQTKPLATPESVPTIASVMQTQLGIVESQFVPAAEAMPEDKYSFAPTNGEYKEVRTFALQVKHVATANFAFYSAILGLDPPPGVTLAGATNGPEDIKTKEQILKYLRDSFALGHKAFATLTAENSVTPLVKPPIPFMNTRLAMASFSCTHASDHYGQMVEYLRMNGIVPPASKGQPPANPETLAHQNSDTTKTSVQQTQAERDGQHDFDFEVGSWNIHLKRLDHRLVGSKNWVEFDGTSVTRKVWGGRADLEEFETDSPVGGHIEGLTLRLYDPQTHQWSIYWATSKSGAMGPPMIGEFKNGRGEFFDTEPSGPNGRAVLVRFIWSNTNTNSPHFEQSFSDDGGKTWEVNWITDQTRVRNEDESNQAH